MEKDRGLIGTVILIIVALALAKYIFDWSIFDVLGTTKGQETWGYIKTVISAGWEAIRHGLDVIFHRS